MTTIKGTNGVIKFFYDGIAGDIDGHYFVRYGTMGCHVSAIKNPMFRIFLIDILTLAGDAKMAIGMNRPENKGSKK